MSRHRRLVVVGLVFSLATAGGTAGARPGCGEGESIDPALRTVAEKSEYRATARYGDVVGLLDRLADSPFARRARMGGTVEGREIPMLIVADPPVATAEEAARQAAQQGKLVVLMIGNIHAGEVCGKEALPMLAREIIGPPHRGRAHPLLKDLILVFAPIYNCDGNERVSKDNRPGQVGPEEGMGERRNADGLDLNRDFIKLEAPETRGLVDVMQRWDPAIFIDTHTTNGSLHRYVLTYEGPRALAGDQRIVRFARQAMLPEVARAAKRDHNLDTFFYGDFDEDHTRWETYPAEGRYSTSYVGLRNRIGILSEAYAYAPYRERVLATRDFVRCCLNYAAANRERIRRLLAEADAATIAAGGRPQATDMVAIRSQPGKAAKKAAVAGYVEVVRDGRKTPGEPRDYEVELWTEAEAALSVSRPFAYVLPPEWTTVREKLRLHGIECRTLRGELEAAVEVYRVDRVRTGREPFQKRSLRTLDVTARQETRTLPAGAVVVPVGQRLGSLVVYLLEPQSEDGLATWDFFGAALTPEADFPVMRLAAPIDAALLE